MPKGSRDPAPKPKAAKGPQEPKASRVWIEMTSAEKALLVRAAGGEKLAAWCRRALLAAARTPGEDGEDDNQQKRAMRRWLPW